MNPQHADANTVIDGTTTHVESTGSLERVYRSNGHILKHIARRITRDRAEAEDIVQIAFLRACAHRPTALHGAHLERWLRTVVRRLAIDHVRRCQVQSRHVALASSWSSSPSDVPPPPYVDCTLAAEIAEEILPKSCGEIFRLWSGGASYQAIAAQLAMPIGTVAARIHRIKLHLRSLSARFLIDEPLM